MPDPVAVLVAALGIAVLIGCMVYWLMSLAAVLIDVIIAYANSGRMK